MSASYQYKVELLNLSQRVGLVTWDASNEIAEQLEERLNKLAVEGWELVAVVPVVKEGSSTMDYQRGYHYFRKLV